MSAATPFDSEAQRKMVLGVTGSPPGDGDAIALQEADFAILDDADREADHSLVLDQLLQPLVDAAIIDHRHVVAAALSSAAARACSALAPDRRTRQASS